MNLQSCSRSSSGEANSGYSSERLSTTSKASSGQIHVEIMGLNTFNGSTRGTNENCFDSNIESLGVVIEKAKAEEALNSCAGDNVSVADSMLDSSLSFRERMRSNAIGLLSTMSAVMGGGVVGIPHAVALTGWNGVILIVLIGSIAAYNGTHIGSLIMGRATSVTRSSEKGNMNQSSSQQASNASKREIQITIVGEGSLDSVVDSSSQACKNLANSKYDGDEEGNDVELHSYCDIVFHLYGKRWSLALAIAQCLHLTLIATMYLIIIADNMGKVFPHLNRLTWYVTAGVAVWGLSWLSNMGRLLAVTVAGTLALIFVIAATVTEEIAQSNLINEQFTGSADTTKWWGGLGNFFLALGVFNSGFGGHGTFVQVVESMPYKSNFNHLITISFTVVTVIYSFLSIVSYSLYGEQLESYSNICLLLADGPLSDTILILFSVFLVNTSLIQLNPVTQYISNHLASYKQKPYGYVVNSAIFTWLWKLVFISVLVLLAYSIPSFSNFQSLVGATTGTLLVFVLPPLLYLKRFGSQLSAISRAFNYFLVCLGIFTGISSTFFAVKAFL
eukprot:Nk52_evm20s1569 gene=Nk52_evmTU20s1569